MRINIQFATLSITQKLINQLNISIQQRQEHGNLKYHHGTQAATMQTAVHTLVKSKQLQQSNNKRWQIINGRLTLSPSTCDY